MGWNLDSSDWKWKNVKENAGSCIIDKIESDLKILGHQKGPIILQHDIVPATPSIESDVIDKIIKVGYKIVDMDRCLNG